MICFTFSIYIWLTAKDHIRKVNSLIKQLGFSDHCFYILASKNIYPFQKNQGLTNDCRACWWCWARQTELLNYYIRLSHRLHCQSKHCVFFSLNHCTWNLKANDTKNTTVLLYLFWSVILILIGLSFPRCQITMCSTELEESLGLGDGL